ncbi:MAG TPA: DUF3536 domain-containing protein, partial [Thermoanaerobaculia bacterium]|nr:DUF3536 domain-containing protein [Thermoanaerobaculia bacterium]
VERWRGDCGCSTGGGPGWNQAWRAPLREALDLLRDELAWRYEEAASALFADPWAARDGAIVLRLDRSAAGELAAAFFTQHARAGHRLSDAERRIAVKLLEMERQTLLMYTSCGWFFNDLAGIETLQILRHASRALHLAQELFAVNLEERFLNRLEKAQSNLAREGNGRRIYERHVRKPGLKAV